MKLAEIYHNLNNYERSLCIYQELLSLLLQRSSRKIHIERTGILYRIGSVYEKFGDITNATKFFHDAAPAFAESGLPCLPE